MYRAPLPRSSRSAGSAGLEGSEGLAETKKLEGSVRLAGAAGSPGGRWGETRQTKVASCYCTGQIAEWIKNNESVTALPIPTMSKGRQKITSNQSRTDDLYLEGRCYTNLTILVFILFLYYTILLVIYLDN